MTGTSFKIAIIGSGPSGCFAAQFLRKAWKDAEITIFEALPVPYGLVRYGVAPDHQGSKSVTAQFDRLFEREGIRFAGNVTIGEDLTFEDLAAAFDIIIPATGLGCDRRLPVEAHPDCPVIGAGALIRALNGHPDLSLPADADGLPMALGSRVAVIGNGNVAMDVVRLLAKPLDQFGGSDIDDTRLAALRGQGVARIDVFGRSPIGAAKFDLSMFKEILGLSNVRIGRSGTGSCPPCDAMQALAAAEARSANGALSIHFHFAAQPIALLHGPHGPLLSVETCDGIASHEVDSVITAVGFHDSRPSGHPCSAQSWSGAQVFPVGWLQNGGKGTIAANRKSAKETAGEINAAAKDGHLIPAAPGFAAVADRIADRLVDYEGWCRIDAHERATCAPGRPRLKLTDRAEMLAVARALPGDTDGTDRPHAAH